MGKLIRIGIAIIVSASMSLHLCNSQLVVSDPAANAQRTTSQKIDIVKQKIQSTSQLLLNVMSGDITGSFEVVSEQLKMAKKLDSISKTLDQVIVASKSYTLFVKKAEYTKSSFELLEKSYSKVLDEGMTAPSRLQKINKAISRSEKAYGRSSDLFKQATDLKNSILPEKRLDMLQEAEDEIDKAQDEIDAAAAEVLAAQLRAQKRKGYIPNMTVPSLNNMSVGSAIIIPEETISAIKYESKARSFARSQRAKEGVKIVFDYGDNIIIIIVLLIMLSAFREKNNFIDIFNTVFYVVVAYSVLRIILMSAV